MSSNPVRLSLSDFGNLGAPYEHEWRAADPREPLVLPNAVFKWYHVHRVGETVSEAMDRDGRALIAGAISTGAWNPEYGLNIGLVHLSTTHAFVIAGVWRGRNELWLRHYIKDLSTSEPFARIDVSGEDVPSACVWEMGVLCHERMAWHRYLFSARSDADKQIWLADAYQGRV